MTKAEIAKIIGRPALLEQTAEECTELAKVCLKMARKLRGENFTQVAMPLLEYELHEEAADIINCIDTLHHDGILDYDRVSAIAAGKMDRWGARVGKENGEHGKER